MLNVGFDNYISKDKILTISEYKGTDMIRLRSNKIDTDECIVSTRGRLTLSIIVLTTGHIVTSSVKSITLQRRMVEC